MIEEDVNFRSHKEIESFLRFILSEAGEIDKDLGDPLFDDADRKRLRKAKSCLNRLVNDDLECDFEIIRRKADKKFDAMIADIRMLI